MQKEASNIFSGGIISDLNPLTTPNEVLTDAINSTIITFTGNEFTLQNDAGNVKIDKMKLEKGFVPIGMKEYGGIVYIASYNPITKECEIGSFPSTKTIYDDIMDDKKPHYGTSDKDYGEHGGKLDKITINLTSLVGSDGYPKKFVGDFFKVYKEDEESEEKSLLQLNPGDKYKIIYNPSNPLVDTLISDNNKSRKLFKVKYYTKSTDGTLKQITKEDIAIIPKSINDKDPTKGFTYFKSGSPGILSVSYEPEDLDVFNVINIVKNGTNGKSSIQTSIYGKSNSLNKFKGVKVTVYKESTPNTTITKYISVKTENQNKITFNIDGLESNQVYIYEFMPFSKYNYFPNYKQTRKVITDQSQSVIDKAVTIFKYYIDEDNGSAMIQFDYNSNDEYIDLYLELYDPWSDVSTIKKVDDASSYNINNIFFDLKEETTNTNFNDSERGGININNLSGVSSFDPIRSPILGSKSYIRKDYSIRKNHFYIVRICALNQDGTTKMNIYRVMYTSNILNNKNNNDTINDFGSLDVSNELVDIDFDISKSENINTSSKEEEGFTEDTLNHFTDGKAYKISKTAFSSSFKYRYEHLIKNEKSDSITIAIKNRFLFGKVNENLITTSIPTPENPEIIEGYSSSNYEPNSTSNISITKVNNLNYDVKSMFFTNRDMVAVPVSLGQQSRNIFKSYPILSSLLYNKNQVKPSNYTAFEFYSGRHGLEDVNIFENQNAWNDCDKYCSIAQYSKSMHLVRAGYNAVYTSSPKNPNSGYASHGRYYTVGNDSLKTFFDHCKTKGMISNNKGSALCTLSQVVYIKNDNVAKMGSESSGYNRDNSRGKVPKWKQCILLMEKSNTEMCYLRLHNSSDIIDFFSKLHICSFNQENVYVIYPDPNKIYSFNNTKTTFKYKPINVNINIGSVGSVYQFYDKVSGKYKDFNKTNIMSYITPVQTAKDELLIVDGNFPKLSSDKSIVKEVNLTDFIIVGSSASNNTYYNILSDGQNAYTNTIVAKPPVNNGELFWPEGTSNPALASFKNYIEAVKTDGNPFSSTDIVSEENFKIRLQDKIEEVPFEYYRYGLDGKNKSTENMATIKINQYE